MRVDVVDQRVLYAQLIFLSCLPGEGLLFSRGSFGSGHVFILNLPKGYAANIAFHPPRARIQTEQEYHSGAYIRSVAHGDVPSG